MAETAPDPLQWTDLSGDDVYYIAHMENETRNAALAMVSEAVVRSVLRGEVSETVTNARQIVHHQELMSHLWLENQARIRGTSAASDPRLNVSITVVPTSQWIREQIESNSRITQASVARDAGLHRSEMSNATSGHRPTSPNTRAKIYRAIMGM